MGEFGTVLVEVGKVFSSIVTIITLTSIIVKPIRKKIVKWIRDTSHTATADKNAQQLVELNNKMTTILNEFEKSKQNDLCMIRHMITQIYYNNIGSTKIRAREREDMESLYDRYEKLGGNSYVKQIVKEMREKETIE